MSFDEILFRTADEVFLFFVFFYTKKTNIHTAAATRPSHNEKETVMYPVVQKGVILVRYRRPIRVEKFDLVSDICLALVLVWISPFRLNAHGDKVGRGLDIKVRSLPRPLAAFSVRRAE